MDAGPNMAVIGLMFLERILKEDLCQSWSLRHCYHFFLKGGYFGRRLACHILWWLCIWKFHEVSLSWLYHCFKAAASAWSSEPLPLVPVPSRVAWLFLSWWWNVDESEDSRNCRMGTKSLKTKFSEDLLELRLINNVSQTICLKGVFRTSASIISISLNDCPLRAEVSVSGGFSADGIEQQTQPFQECWEFLPWR